MKIVYDKGGIFPKQFGNFHLALLEKEEGDLESALRDAEAKVFLQVAIVEMVLSSFGALPGFLIDMMCGAIFRNNTYQLFLLETVVKDVKNTGLRKLWQGEKSTPIVAYCGQNITPFKYANVSKPEHYADMVAGRMDEILSAISHYWCGFFSLP